MRTQIPFAGTGVELCPANVSGTGRSAIGQYFNLSLVTVPGVIAKVTRPSSPRFQSGEWDGSSAQQHGRRDVI